VLVEVAVHVLKGALTLWRGIFTMAGEAQQASELPVEV
jgi:hypothetical protein